MLDRRLRHGVERGLGPLGRGLRRMGVSADALTVFGLLASVGHFILIKAYDYANATALAPFFYTQLVWVMLLGWLVFGDFPDGWSLLGMGIIVASGIYLVGRQRLTTRRA